MRNISLKTKAKGFSLLEILAVLAIIAIGIFFLLRNRDSAESRQNTNALSSQALALFEGMKSARRNGDFTGFDTANFIASRQAPPDMVRGTELRHSFKGTVTVAAANVGSGTNNGAAVTFNTIPGTACKPLLDTVEPQVAEITVGTTTVKNATTTYSETTAATACNNDTNTVVFTKAG